MTSTTDTVRSTRQPYESVAFPDNDAVNHIRVLNLHSGDQDIPLTGTLEVLEVDKTNHTRLDFSALSYVWGQYRSAAHIITCNGHTLSITENCFNALNALRDLYGDVRIWVDAICIDQENMKEKEKQIPLMPYIYKTGTPVYVWLGQGNILFDQMLKIIKTASHLEETTKKHDFMATPNIHPSAWTWINLLRLRRNIRDLERSVETSGSSIDKLDLDCEWLHRVWTMQEIMFAKNATFLYGRTEVSWKEMVGVWYFTTSKEEKGSHASSLQFAFGDGRGLTWMTFLHNWGDIMSQWSYNKMVLLRPHIVNNIERRLTSVFGTQTMENLRTRRTSNKYDHVYALHGILTEAYERAPPDPDYGQPLDVVYEQFIIYLFSLDHVYLNLLADSGTHQALPGAPTWLPDWSTPLEKRTWLSHDYLKRLNQVAIAHEFGDESMCPPDSNIEILSVVHNRTLKVSAAFHGDTIFCNSLEEEFSSAVVRKAIAAQSDFDLDPETDIPETFISQFSALTLLYTWLRVGFCIEGFREDPTPFLFTIKGVGLTSEEIELANQPSSLAAVSQLKSDLFEAVMKSKGGFSSTEPLLRSLELVREAQDNPDMVDILGQFAGSMRNKRSIFITEDGATGSGPLGMIPGDKIAFIAGMSVPMALRQQETSNGQESHYTVVGPVVFSPREAGPVKANWSTGETISLI